MPGIQMDLVKEIPQSMRLPTSPILTMSGWKWKQTATTSGPTHGAHLWVPAISDSEAVLTGLTLWLGKWEAKRCIMNRPLQGQGICERHLVPPARDSYSPYSFSTSWHWHKTLALPGDQEADALDHVWVLATDPPVDKADWMLERVDTTVPWEDGLLPRILDYP